MAKFNYVIEGDCVRVLKALPSESVDLVVTDPPYLVRYQDRAGRTIANDDNPNCLTNAFREVYRLMKPNTFCVSFYGWNRVDDFFRAWRGAGFRPVGHLVWHKDYASSTGYLRARHEQAYLLAKGRPARPAQSLDDVRAWKYTGNVRHPTEKDVSILRPLIEGFSKPGDVVLDPFAGSGSTLVAAAMAGRRYLGVELESEYCALARRRLDRVAATLGGAHSDIPSGSSEEPALEALWELLTSSDHHEAARTVWQALAGSVN